MLRWPILFGVALIVLAIIYRYGPSRTPARWRWVSWGAAVATAIWTLGSIAFSIYVQNFGSYNETYGSLGAVVILLMWFWLSAFIVLLGAELNSEMEHQTERDSTTAGRSRSAAAAPTSPTTSARCPDHARQSSLDSERLQQPASPFRLALAADRLTPHRRRLRAPASGVTRSGECSRPGATTPSMPRPRRARRDRAGCDGCGSR